MGNLRVGVIGGGQLARMMIVPSINLGLDLKVFSETHDAPAAAATTVVGDYTQLASIREFAATVDVITFDHEHVPLSVLRVLEDEGVSVQPPSRALEFAQNKLLMRKRLAELNLAMPVWAEIKTEHELQEFLDANGGVCILKTPIGGYDGKGVRVVRTVTDAADWLTSEGLSAAGGSLLAEEKVNFVREVAQLSARRPSGEFAAWPLTQTTQANGVCAEVICPAPNTSADLIEEAGKIAHTIAQELGVTGVLAVEMFETPNGRLLINELAMRPHNSGHFSIEGSETSQFEQHLRAVLDLPLGSTRARAAASVMVNVLGIDSDTDLLGNLDAALAQHPEAKVHTYGKAPRAGRKMGHVTVVSEDLQFALAQAHATAKALLQG
jgi:5-(carboxyamino)imidazole ribonucleotide synthase